MGGKRIEWCQLRYTNVVISFVRTVPPKQPCNNGSFPSDTIVLLDGSNSITEANFHKYMLNFTKQVAKALNISQSGNRLGVVQFSTNQVLEIPLDKGNDLKSVSDLIHLMDEIINPINIYL